MKRDLHDRDEASDVPRSLRGLSQVGTQLKEKYLHR